MVDSDIYHSRMYYQTTLRNIGLYTSLSFAALAYSRIYRKKHNNVYNISLILVSLLFLIIAIMLNYNIHNFIIKDIVHKEPGKHPVLSQLKNVTYGIFLIHGILMTLGILTMIRSL